MGNRLLIVVALILCGCGSTPQKSKYGNPDNVFIRKEKKTSVKGDSSNRTLLSSEPTLRLLWPLEDYHRASRGFKTTRKKPHVGLDIPAPKGTEILSAESGRVIYAGQAFHGYGKMVLIDHSSPNDPSQIATLYAHCSKLFVRSGQQVKRGQEIALVGRTGHATGTHLHFEVRINQEPVDPLEFYSP